MGMMHQDRTTLLVKGLRDGLPIGLGYLSVSFAFGILVVSSGLPVWLGVVMSMTNVTSAGQFAGLTLITSGASYLEMALTQLVINMRYALMSLSLSQKLDKGVSMLDRIIIAFCNTDEVFAVASAQKGEVGRWYLYGLICIPYAGWALGTFLGAVASGILPEGVISALGIALYGMFIAIIIPPAKYSRSVLWVLIISVVLSCLFRYVPVLHSLSSGLVIIVCAVAASVIGAWLFPLKEVE